jgi:hypothetical protein
MNMSYCRFQNTLLALEDCEDYLDVPHAELSKEERMARARIVAKCRRIAEWSKDADWAVVD